MILIQSTVSGYGGKPVSLFSAYDPDAEVLAISVEADYRRERRENCVVLTNDLTVPRDGLFTEDDMQDGINAFFSLKTGIASDGKSPRLTFGSRAGRADPSSVIEKDGVDTSGFRYRISDAVTCSQVAAVITCWYAYKRAGTLQNMFAMVDSLNSIGDRLNAGEVITF